jgi:hypothetical protein
MLFLGGGHPGSDRFRNTSLLTLDGYPTSPANFAQGNRVPQNQKTPRFRQIIDKLEISDIFKFLTAR